MSKQFVIYTGYSKYDEDSDEYDELRADTVYEDLIKKYDPEHIRVLKQSFDMLKENLSDMPEDMPTNTFLIRNYNNIMSLDGDKNVLLENMKSIMTLEEFKNISYQEIKFDNFPNNLYVCTDERIIKLFKTLSNYSVGNNCIGTYDFIFVEIKNEFIPYIEFSLSNTYTFINNTSNKYIIRFGDKITGDEGIKCDCYVIAYVDMMKYTKDIIEKYKTSDEILKRLINPNETIKTIDYF